MEDTKSQQATEEEDVEGGDDWQLDTLEMKARAHPNDFTVAIEYVTAVRSKFEKHPALLSRLRDAREAAASRWPLPEELWVEWLQDEMTVASEETPRRVEVLCRRALGDYLSVDIWLLLCDVVGMQGGDRIAATFEEAIASGAGLHVIEGIKIWNAFRNIVAGSKSSDVEAVGRLFLRQLSIPLSGMEPVLTAYEEWAEASGVSEEQREVVREACAKAQAQLAARVPYEQAISDSGTTLQPDYSKLDAWWSYISFEESSSGSPQRVAALYERAAKVFAVVPNVWFAFTKFADKGMGKEQALAVYARAVRNCPSNGPIWASYLRALERAGKPARVVDEAAGKAKEVLDTPEGLIEVLHSHIDAVRRRRGPPEELRAVCAAAVELASSRFPRRAAEASLLQQWGRFEARLFKDFTKARELWEKSLKMTATGAQAWLEFADLERTFGQPDKCRSIFKRAVNAVSQGVEAVVQSWVQFEREEGTLEQWQAAWDRGSQRIELVREALRRQAEEAHSPEEQRKKPQKQQREGPLPKKRVCPEGDAQEREGAAGSSADTAEGHRRPLSERNASTVYVSNVPFHLQEDSLGSMFSAFGSIVAVRIGRDKGGKSRGFAFVEFEDEESATAALAADKTDVEGRKLSVVPSSLNPEHKQPPPPPATAVDTMSVFVSNLSFQATEDDLRALFSPCGEIAEVRLVRETTGKSKGFAYVQFKEAASVAAGLALDKRMLLKRAIKVQPARSRQTGGRGQAPALAEPAQQQSDAPMQVDDGHSAAKEEVTFAVPRSLRTREKP